jgi:hypothetical protein
MERIQILDSQFIHWQDPIQSLPDTTSFLAFFL